MLTTDLLPLATFLIKLVQKVIPATPAVQLLSFILRKRGGGGKEGSREKEERKERVGERVISVAMQSDIFPA